VSAALSVFAWVFRSTRWALWPSISQTVAYLSRLMTRSLPVVVVVNLAAGAMLTVQAAVSLYLVGAGPLAGMVVALGGVREVFPLLTVAAIAARTGAEFASELGTMRVTQQLDALDVMGVDPVRLLVGPRIAAAILGTPLCVIVADAAGVWGSYLVGALQLGIDRGSLWVALMSVISSFDIAQGCAKGLVLGWLVGVIATREGFNATTGARGVGVATNRAVVRSMIVVCIISLGMTYLFYGRTAF
jgi:phospholipid/cholesterol/gamma-HCH transport system permease protein